MTPADWISIGQGFVILAAENHNYGHNWRVRAKPIGEKSVAPDIGFISAPSGGKAVFVRISEYEILPQGEVSFCIEGCAQPGELDEYRGAHVLEIGRL